MGRIDVIWLHANKPTVYYLPSKVESELYRQDRSHLVTSIQTYQVHATKQLCTTHPLKFKVNCMVRTEERYLLISLN